MGRQDYYTFARVTAVHLRPIFKPAVFDAPFQAAIKEPAEPNVLGGAEAQINVGGAENPSAFPQALVGKSKRQVAQTDPNVATIEQETKPTPDNTKPVEHKIRKQAECVQHHHHYIKYQLPPEIECESGGWCPVLIALTYRIPIQSFAV